MKIRTIKSAVSDIKSVDPNSAVTEYFIRKLCVEHKIPYAMSGKKYLVDVDVVNKYIESQCGNVSDKRST